MEKNIMNKKFTMVALAIVLILTGCQNDTGDSINRGAVRQAEKIIGLNFTNSEIDSLLPDLNANLADYQKIREQKIENSVPPALNFNPLPLNFIPPTGKSKFILGTADRVKMPENIQDLAFYSVRDLGVLIRTKKISSMELTKFFIERLKKYDPQLHCVITLTEELALEEAAQADKELAAGNYRGPLHGIPYGAKDLLAKKGYKTTWGAMPYKDQMIDEDATVIKKLHDAGAVLVAKMTLGALAWGDVWYGEKTRNPWNPEQGSSGSSAGSASATAAGLLPFAIGSETWGSIVSPSTRCGTTGLRPTYGRVSRAGAMALSWSMDKLGTICRTVEDCAIVFNAIYGPDGKDQTVVNFPFQYDARMNLKQLKIGYLKSSFDEDYPMKETDANTLQKIRDLGFELIPIELPDIPVSAISFVLSAESAAAFDDLTLSNQDDQLVRQIRNAWPNVFRASRFILAVEYIQANRLRYQLIQEMQKVMEKVDIYIAPSFDTNLLLTNLTGHPCVVLPNGFNDKNSPVSISFMGRLFDEGKLIAFADAYQRATDFHKKHPEGF
jgi:Asp-tRNA(Asn)/Glu-tRNA(Gln) amidotransferase A subunit family amidase